MYLKCIVCITPQTTNFQLFNGSLIWQNSLKLYCSVCNDIRSLILTHPFRGSHAGTLLHMSLSIRKTITHDFSPLTLSWGNQRESPSERKATIKSNLKPLNLQILAMCECASVCCASVLALCRADDGGGGGAYVGGVGEGKIRCRKALDKSFMMTSRLWTNKNRQKKTKSVAIAFVALRYAKVCDEVSSIWRAGGNRRKMACSFGS